jgi:hypothetical protein
MALKGTNQELGRPYNRRIVLETIRLYGPIARGDIDILVNNAAIFDLSPVEEITENSYDRIFAVNVKGLLFTLQAVAKSMIKRGKGGKIINMASQAGRRGEALVAVYCASKAALADIDPGTHLRRLGKSVNDLLDARAAGEIDPVRRPALDGIEDSGQFNHLQPVEAQPMSRRRAEPAMGRTSGRG